jgi:murein DD-endopeptidase MepM/ murein hydrolase activator NlpD
MLPALMSEPEKQRAANAGTAANASTSTTSSTSGELSGDFYKQLLTILALSMAMPGSSGQSGQSGLAGMSSDASSSGGMGNFMAPVLLTLIEQLLSKQVEQAEPQATTIRSGPADGAGESSDAESFGDDVPAGLPVKGYQTQASHPGHVAIDIGVPVGSDVKTTMNGKVVYAGWNNEGYGNLVIVENGPYRTYYGHLSKIPVHVGEQVKAGDLIAKSGNTGNSTGPHLHYEVRLNNHQVDPARYMKSHKA